MRQLRGKAWESLVPRLVWEGLILRLAWVWFRDQPGRVWFRDQLGVSGSKTSLGVSGSETSLGDVVTSVSGSALSSPAPKTRRERGGSATRSLVVSEPDIAVLQQQLQEMKDKV